MRKGVKGILKSSRKREIFSGCVKEKGTQEEEGGTERRGGRREEKEDGL